MHNTEGRRKRPCENQSTRLMYSSDALCAKVSKAVRLSENTGSFAPKNVFIISSGKIKKSERFVRIFLIFKLDFEDHFSNFLMSGNLPIIRLCYLSNKREADSSSLSTIGNKRIKYICDFFFGKSLCWILYLDFSSENIDLYDSRK